MKQLLFTLILFLSGINILHAQETNSIEETTWNVIRERLFSGENSKAYRFEEDIRFQLKGEVTKDDSIVMQNIVSELKDIIEIVDVRLVNEDGNFVINFLSAGSGINWTTNYRLNGTKIYYTELSFSYKDETSVEKIEKEIQYYVYRYLTRIFENQFQTTLYGGIYDQRFPEIMPLNAIDKDLLRKLYSKDFYKLLKENTVKKFGFLYYFNLRFEPWIKRLSRALSIVLVIAGFLYLLSGKKNKRNRTFLNYLIRGFQVLLWILASYLILTLPDTIPFRLVSNMWVLLVAQAMEVLVVGIVSIFMMLLLEHLFLKRIDNFFYQQVFVLFSTFFSIFFCYFFLSLPFLYFNLSAQSASMDYSQLVNPSMIFNYSIIAFLRVLYNFIEYKMQSIVNQKDVELAKMKELKNQAELNALHSRINPHFLYNSLNSIASLAHINPDKTENMALALSELFRYSINKENKTFVKVEEELEMVKKYLEIEKTRFAEKLNYTITVDEAAKEKLIPKFLIQPLAENAVKHGLSKITETGRIAIEVKQLENDLVIAIFDNGPDFPDEPVSGYGLQNLNDKLEILYGKQASIYWENGDNKHFRITIKNQF
ncbi:MAG: sensor histidine kinase [Draconibacterium sp.]